MERGDLEALGQFVKEHHVHYEIEPEAVFQGDRREVVGYEVRLFATQGESKLRAPGCRRCDELLGELQSFAELLLGEGGAATSTGIAPASRALYESSEVPGADEVSLAMHVRCGSADGRQAEEGVRQCMHEVQKRLGEVGIPRR